MSMHGLAVCAWLLKGEAKVEWWERYENRFTPDEIKDLRDGIYNAIKRPLPPAFGDDTWITVTDKFRVHVATVRPHKGEYRIVIDQVEDFRSEHVHMRPMRDHSPTLENTIVLLNPPDLAEVEGIPHDQIKNGASAALARAAYETVQEDLRRLYASLPVAERLKLLQRQAADQHVDISSEERVIENKLRQIEAKVHRSGEQKAA